MSSPNRPEPAIDRVDGNAPLHRPAHPVRFITAASLFDGHDAAINIMRRLLQAQGAEVVHLGHNRSVDEVVAAAIAEDVQGVAISSYQGGHVEYFKYLVDRLEAEGRGDIAVYGGGGGVIVPSEIAELEAYGVRRIFSPSDGQRLGLERMINLLIEECDRDLAAEPPDSLDLLYGGHTGDLARVITCLEAGIPRPGRHRGDRIGRAAPESAGAGRHRHGGSGKSSLTDEIIRRFRQDQEDKLADRRAGRRPDPPPRRRGPPRRPNQDERHRLVPGVLPVARHPGLGLRDPPASSDGGGAPVGPPVSTWSSWRPRASARVMPPSSISPTSPST